MLIPRCSAADRSCHPPSKALTGRMFRTGSGPRALKNNRLLDFGAFKWVREQRHQPAPLRECNVGQLAAEPKACCILVVGEISLDQLWSDVHAVIVRCSAFLSLGPVAPVRTEAPSWLVARAFDARARRKVRCSYVQIPNAEPSQDPSSVAQRPAASALDGGRGEGFVPWQAGPLSTAARHPRSASGD